jgi:hypothetical protein
VGCSHGLVCCCCCCCCAGLARRMHTRQKSPQHRQQPAALAEPRAPAIGTYLPTMHNTTQYPISLAHSLRPGCRLGAAADQGAGCRSSASSPVPSPMSPATTAAVRSGQVWSVGALLYFNPPPVSLFLNPSSLFPFPRQLLDPRPAPPPPSVSPASHCLSLPFAAA